MDDAFFSSLFQRSLALALVACLGALAPGCANFKEGTTARSFLNRAADPDPNVRFHAYANLARTNCYDNAGQKAEAIQLLTSRLESKQESLASRAVICRTLGALGDQSARPALIKAVDDPEPLIREEACRSLGKVGIEEDAVVLSRIAAVDTFYDCKVAALDGLADLKPHDTRVLQSLVLGMEDDTPAIRYSSLVALKKITQKDLGIEPGPWKKYVQELMAATPPSTPPAQVATQPPPSSPSQVEAARWAGENPSLVPKSRNPASWNRTPRPTPSASAPPVAGANPAATPAAPGPQNGAAAALPANAPASAR